MEGKIKLIDILGKSLLVFPNVFDPCFLDSQLLAKSINKLDFNVKDVLDLGTGCGIQAIFISKKAKKVTASDINPFALENARLNIKIHKLENKIEVVKSDLFSHIRKKYDLIIFNPPFFSFKPKNLIEKNISSYNSNILKRFFKDVGKHLKDNGKVIILFSDIGNFDYFKKLATKHFSKTQLLAHEKCKGDNYFAYLLTNPL